MLQKSSLQSVFHNQLFRDCIAELVGEDLKRPAEQTAGLQELEGVEAWRLLKCKALNEPCDFSKILHNHTKLPV